MTADDMPGFLTDFASSRVVSADAIAKTALRYEYEGWERPLAHIASGGAIGLDQIRLTAAAIAAGEHIDPDRLTPLNASGLYALAYLTLGRPGDPGRIASAADLFALARQVAERDGSPTEHTHLDLQAHLACGRLDYLRQHAPTSGASEWILWAAEADIGNPFGGPEPATSEAWHEIFNAPFVERGIAPMSFTDVDSPFDSVTTEAIAGSVDGPLVSIVMPVYSPSLSLLTAVRSLLEQTWRNIQVILVDDASPAGFEPIFEQVRNLDERVEYVRMPTNGGAYRARNRGVSLARGEIVGIQDGDDWSHPQRIERQMRLFDADPGLVATLSMAIRLHANLRITKVGSLPFAKNAPSLLFKRDLVLERLGKFDEMRRAADTEFIERLGAAFGPCAVEILREPLALYQLTEGSLSREDFRLSWHREARVSYHGCFRHWHRQIAEDGADPVVETPAGRAFPAPPELLGTSYPVTPPDVVVLADWRAGPLAHSGLPAEIAALADAGLEVGLARADAIRFATDKRYYAQAAIQQLLQDGRASWTPLGVDISPPLLLVRDTDLLALPRSAGAVRLRPDRVVVVADRLPWGGDTPRVSYDPARVEQVVRTMFDRPTEWLPATDEISQALAAGGATGPRHHPHLCEVVTVTRFPQRPFVSPPVIGVADASRFAVERADRTTLSTILPRGPGHDVRLLESSATPRDLAPGWLTFHPGLVTQTEFFDQCDVVVGLAPQVPGSSLLRPILEAMARGCVPIVDDSYRSVLGDAALYLGDGTVQQHLDALTTGVGRFDAQQLRALRFCQNEISADAYASAISMLTATGAQR